MEDFCKQDERILHIYIQILQIEDFVLGQVQMKEWTDSICSAA